ncbi:MAG: hypothetical protein RMJ60_08380 [Anaerolineales bacterium]|nr:hypothetical protein [Anaerolineales bacterium]
MLKTTEIEKGESGSSGSLAFVAEFPIRPEAVVIVDMVVIGTSILTRQNSSLILRQEIWEQAASLGYTQFISSGEMYCFDDHIPFLKANIKSVRPH